MFEIGICDTVKPALVGNKSKVLVVYGVGVDASPVTNSVSAGNGRACACATPAMGTVIGKALENFDGESGIIEIVVGRM